jgi:NAD(P)-dependent dehydrogenase (short-subunit alcohol dehydrogenase family)
MLLSLRRAPEPLIAARRAVRARRCAVMPPRAAAAAQRAPIVLITGASSGIGASLALRLSASGAALVLCGRDQAALERVASACVGAPCLPVVADLTDDAAVAALVDAALRRFGGIDALVNNAGGAVACSASALTASVAAAEIDVNFLSAVRVTSAALPALRASARGGRVLCVGSLLALLPARAGAQRGGYAAAKAALHAWCFALAEDVASHGVTVTLVVPGPVSGTPFGARAAAAAASATTASSSAVAAAPAPVTAMPVSLPLAAQSADEVAAVIADALLAAPCGGPCERLLYTSDAIAALVAAEGQT